MNLNVFSCSSSSCISEFFDAREYATPSDGVPSEYSSDEDIGSEGENEDSISEDDEEVRIFSIFLSNWSYQ